MTFLVGHSSQFPAMVEKTVAVDGAIQTAAPICFSQYARQLTPSTPVAAHQLTPCDPGPPLSRLTS